MNSKVRRRKAYPGFDVTNYGALVCAERFVQRNIRTGQLAILSREKNALISKGYNPNALVLVDRIGETGIFCRVTFSEPILVNENGEILDIGNE